jgi:hypothetical protein
MSRKASANARTNSPSRAGLCRSPREREPRRSSTTLFRASPRSLRMRDIVLLPDATDHVKSTLAPENCAPKSDPHLNVVARKRCGANGPPTPIATAVDRRSDVFSLRFFSPSAGTRLGESNRERPAGHVALPPTYRILARSRDGSARRSVRRFHSPAILAGPDSFAGGREGGEDDWPNQSFFPPSHPRARDGPQVRSRFASSARAA